MTDRISLREMTFFGRHGVSDEERAEPQVITVDVDLQVDLREAGTHDDLALTVNYSEVFDVCRTQVEDQSYRLLEAIAEAIAGDLLARFERVQAISVSVRKPGVPIDGILDHAGVSIERSRGD